MPAPGFEFRFDGVSGDPCALPEGRDGRTASVFPPQVITETRLTTVGPASGFELDPAMPSRGGEWSGQAGTVEIETHRETDQPELLVVRCANGYRVLVPEATAADRLTYRLPASPGPAADRGPLGAAVRWVVQKVVVPVIGEAVAGAGERLVRRWENARRPHRMRYYTAEQYRTAGSEGVEPSQLRSGRLLLLLHGTNAQSHDQNGLGGLPPDLVEQLNSEYDQVIAFDHPTLATSPVENAEALATWLAQAGADIDAIDVLCHSRGGLVARELIEEVAPPIRFGSVVFVATPHAGTELADARHLGGFVDRMLTLAMVIPDNPISIAVEGALTIAAEMATGVFEHLDGVSCMAPSSPWLRSLTKGPPSGTSYRAISADFETAPGSGIWHSLKDAGVDVVFGGLPNDVVIPTLSALRIGDDPGSGFTDMVVFDDLDSVAHSRYFSHDLVQPVLRSWLKPVAGPLPAHIRSRSKTSADVRTLAQLGPEWSLAQKIGDLTCLAPEPYREPLQAKVEQFGARLWKAITGRDDAAAPSTVVLLPGIMGSEMAVGGRRIWLSPWQLAQGGFDRLRLGPGDGGEAQATEMLCFAYRQVLEHFRHGYEVVEFPYDWRRSVSDAARSLIGVLAELATSDDRAAGSRIHIVAHSMGGLVVRRARQLASADRATDPFPSLGGELVLLGTPNRGSFGTPLALAGKHSLVSNLARLDLRADRAEWLRAMWTFPGLLELLPHASSSDSDDLTWLYEAGRWPEVAGDRHVQGRLDDVRALHDELSGDAGDGLHVVLGDGLPTPVAVRPVASDRFEVQIADTGDGTVAVACGQLDGATLHYTHGTNHGDLVRDQKVLAAVGQLLETGETRLLRDAPVEASRGAATAATAAWLPPDVAEEQLFGGVRGTSRDIASAGSPPPAWSRHDALVAGLDAVSAFVGRPTVEAPALVVTVAHGSLECAKFPVLVGHATGTPIAGAEARCDELLGHQLSELNVLGSYPAARGDHLYVPRTRREHRLDGCVVVALDSTAPLSASELSDQVSRAVVDYAERRRWEDLRDDRSEAGSLGLSAVPMGSGPAVRLGIERSIDAIVAGVQRANVILLAQDRRPVAHLEFVERYAGKAERIMWSLQRLRDRADATSGQFGSIELGTSQITQAEGALAGVPPPSYDSGRWERLSVDVEGNGDPRSSIRRLTYQFAHDRAAVSERPRRVDRTVVAELLSEAVRRPSRSLALGAVLFEELLPAELKEELSRTDNLVLQVDQQTADLPWELLVDRLVGNEPLACRAGLLRQFRSEDARPRSGGSIALSALVFGDPPTDLVRLPGARREALDVWRLMRGHNVDAQLLQFEDLAEEGRSSAARVKEAFRSRDHRIIHIAAHGLYRVPDGNGSDPAASIEGGVAIGKGAYLTADDFANLRIAPDLVFLNCCHLGRLRTGEHADGQQLLDPVDQQQAAASIAKRLMDIGVKAVLVAGWTVGDQAGRLFAERFYDAMLDGRPYGDAVRTARLAVFRRYEHTDNTWAAYQCYGDPGFQLATQSTVHSTSIDIPLRASAARQLEELYVRVGESDDVEPLVSALRALDGEVARHWANDGELLSLCGRALADLGCFADAIERYERAVAVTGTAPVRAIEQLVNLAARHAVMLKRLGAPADEVAQFDAKARQWAAVVEALGPTSERRAIIASMVKRRAILEPDRWLEHLHTAASGYVDAAERTVVDPLDVRDLYAFRNAIQLGGLLLDDASTVGPLLTTDWVTPWAGELLPTPSSGPFWERVGRPNSMLTAVIVSPGSKLAAEIAAVPLTDGPEVALLHEMLDMSIADAAAAIAAAYLESRSGARTREWSSVVENVELLRDVAEAGRSDGAAGLRTLAEALADV